MHHLHLNVWPLLVSALFLWMLGAVWYSPPLFAKPWMAALRITPNPADRKGLIPGMIASFIGDLITALVMAHIIGWAHANTIGWGVFIGFLVWFGFIAAPSFPQGIYERRPTSLFLINTGYWLVGLIAVGALLAVWR